jgi:DNA repair photolyase
MRQIEYIEQPCGSALNRVEGMPFRWSLNPYRGCVHGCHYCYARATYPYLGFDAGEDFSTRIVVKTNVAEVLRRELRRSSWWRERVAIGTATDAYQPCEGRYRLTRLCLEALAENDTPVSVVTKSTLILRDLDLLAALSHGPGVAVYFTITTLDPDVWRMMEPGTPPPLQRLRVMRRLSEAGVRTGVFLAPILPGITDAADSIERVAAAAREHGAATFGSAVLRLAPAVKEHYFGVVARAFPDLLPRYERAYSGTNATADYQRAIEIRVARVREKLGFDRDAMREREPGVGPASPRSTGRFGPVAQLALPLAGGPQTLAGPPPNHRPAK